VRDKHALKRPSKHALEERRCRSSITEEKEPSGAAWTKPHRHASQPPDCSLKAMVELEHVKRQIGKYQRRARAMEERRLGNAADRPKYKVLDLTAPGRWSWFS
jgi:hypothetical protein